MTVGNIIIARLESKRFCTTRRTLVGFSASKQQIELTVDSQTDVTNSEQELSILDQAMRGAVAVYTYLGGLPGEFHFLTSVGMNWFYLAFPA